LFEFTISFCPEFFDSLLSEREIDIVCSLKVGGSIGGYLVTKYLGGGVYGNVFECSKSGKKYALKFQNFKFHNTELEALEKLDHEHVINIVESTTPLEIVGQRYGCFFMPFCEQGTIQEYVEAFGINARDVVVSFLPLLLRGLDHMHKSGIVHCDIKPPNIVMKKGMPMICDLGLSNRLPEGKSFGRCKDTIYTPWYRCLVNWETDELIRFSRLRRDYTYSPTSDLWAMFLTFLHLVSGDRYNREEKFRIFRDGSYNHPNPQQRIDFAIDSVFSDSNVRIGDLFKKYLNIENCKRLNALMTSDPHSQITIVTDALQDLMSLIETFDADEKGVCVDPGTKVTPPRPYSSPKFSPINEKLDDGEDSDGEDSDGEDSDREDSEEEDSN